jgi:hypothetical protein
MRPIKYRPTLPVLLSMFHVLCMIGVLIARHTAEAWTIAERMSFGVYWFCEKLFIALLSSTSSRLHGVIDKMGIQTMNDYLLWFLWPLLLVLGTFQWYLVGLGIDWLIRRFPKGLSSNMLKSIEKHPFLKRLLGLRVQPRSFLLIVGALPFLFFTLTDPNWVLYLIITLGFVLQSRRPSLIGWLLLVAVYVAGTGIFLMLLTDDLMDLMAGKPTWYFPITESSIYFLGSLVFGVTITTGLLFSKPYRKA